MMCIVCRKKSSSDQKFTLFSFPVNTKRLTLWLENLHITELREQIVTDKYKTYKVCESHFDPRFVHKSRFGKKLTRNAYPKRYPHENQKFTYEVTVMDADKSFKTELLNNSRMSHTGSPNNQQESLMTKALTIGTEILFEKNYVKSKENNTEINAQNVIKHKQPLKNHGDDILNGENHSLSQIVKWAVSCKQEDKDRMNLFALNLYYSGNAYDFLQDVLSLPAKDILKYSLVPKTTKLDDILLNAMKCKVKNMSAKERICSVAVGAMKLTENLYYDIKHDRVVGFHDVNGKQKSEPAQHAIVLVVQGIVERWVQPITYSFISEEYDIDQIPIWIDETIIKLMQIGFDIRAFISDPKSEFCTSDSRKVTKEEPYFSLNDKNIYYIYDSGQLMNAVRNYSKTCDFYETDLLECNDTKVVNFLDQMENLINVLNAKSRFSNLPFKGAFVNNKFQIDFLEQIICLLQNMKVIRRNDGKDITPNVKFIDYFVITIESITQLFSDLKVEEIKLLLTHRLTYNCYINKFLNKVKSENHECTGRQFNKHFVRSFVLNMLKKPAGCKEHNPQVAEDFRNYSQEIIMGSPGGSNSYTMKSKKQKTLNTPLRVFTTEYREILPKNNRFGCICRFIFLKSLQKHCCNKLQPVLEKFQMDESLADLRLSDNSSVYIEFEKFVPASFITYIQFLEKKFKEYLTLRKEIVSLGQEMLLELLTYECHMLCPCFPVEYVTSLFIRIRIFFTVRENNRMFKRRDEKSFEVFRL